MPDSTKLCRLRALHASLTTLARQSPELLSEPELPRAMEAALTEAMVDCLGSPEQQRHSPAQLRHAAILARFRELLDANLDRPLYLPEVCAAIGVSHRALSYSCQDFLGMPPKRYFFLRRMHMVRRVLLRSDRRATTVTAVATRHGFWEFGRFAVQYRKLFDEMPSATLRRVQGNAHV
ncbi:MAG TPA: helix-turn-helix domain-containing protein [Acetobacteraceae bacterium]|nr:helix-turn-helix domain-containing protein [Acetobacteraceae bacterium]